MIITKDVENNVLNELKEMMEFPEKGIVAGQALSSLFFKHLKLDLKTPFNDIDLFIDKEIYDGYNSHFRTFNSDVLLKSKEPSNFGEIDFFASRGYAVLNSRVFENKKSKIPINIIKIKSFNVLASSMDVSNTARDNINRLKEKDKNKINIDEFKNGVFADDIINNFDINCCAVGYDFKRKTFSYSKMFLTFLDDKKLRLQSIHSPHISLLRLYKKIEDLNCNKDIDDEIRLIELFMYNNTPKIIVGERFFEAHEKYKTDVFDDIFTISSSTQNKKTSNGTYFYSEINKSIKLEKKVSMHPKNLSEKEQANFNYYFNTILKEGIAISKMHCQTYYTMINVLDNKKDLHYIYNDKNKYLFFNQIVVQNGIENYNYKDLSNYNNLYSVSKNAPDIIGLMHYLKSIKEKDDFSKLFIKKSGEFDTGKYLLFKFDLITENELEIENLDIMKYISKPKKVGFFFNIINNKREVLYLALKNKERIFFDYNKDHTYYYAKFFSKIIFHEKIVKEDDGVVFKYRFSGKKRKFFTSKKPFGDIFPNINLDYIFIKKEGKPFKIEENCLINLNRNFLPTFFVFYFFKECYSKKELLDLLNKSLGIKNNLRYWKRSIKTGNKNFFNIIKDSITKR